MNIAYLHGFASNFDPQSNKVNILKKIGSVDGVDIDYCQDAKTLIELMIDGETHRPKSGDASLTGGFSTA